MSDRSVVRLGRPRVRRDVLVGFWSLIAAGAEVEAAAAGCGLGIGSGWRYFRQAGGVNPRLKPAGDRYLSFAERELIGLWLVERASLREIARRLGRAPSTVSRELRRNARTHARGPGDGGRIRPMPYLASVAHDRAQARARRPKPRKLAANPGLAAYVEARLAGRQRWSPEQISAKLAQDFPHDKGMRVSHETIYQCLYVQGRGGLRRELTACLRTGRAVRQPNRREGQRRARVPAELLISERPAEAADRAVPGHWEGDLIL
jgi:transposase, IS30 family